MRARDGEGSDPFLDVLLDVRTVFDPSSALTATLHAAIDAEARPFAVAWVALPDADEGLVIEHVLGQRTTSLDHLDVGSGQGLTGKVFDRAHVNWVDEYIAADSITHEFDSVIEAEGIRRMIAAPLMVDEDVLGVLSVGRRDVGAFADRTVDDLVRLARQASAALSIAREARVRATSAAVAERRRVAEEVHDGVGALMFSLLARVERLRHRAAHTELTQDVENVGRDLNDVSTLVGSLVADWHQSASSNVRAEVQGVVEEFERRSGLDTTFVFMGTVPVLDLPRIHAITRFVGVALSNVERHSGASRVSVTVSGLPAQVTVAVSNDGPAPSVVTPGIGLGGAEERFARLGGTLTRIDEGADGFTVRARLPLLP